MSGKNQPWLYLVENGSSVSSNLLVNSYTKDKWSSDSVELPLNPEIWFIRTGYLLQTYIKNGMEKELILENPSPYVANELYLADSNGIVQDATIKTYLEQNGDAEGKGGIYLVRLPEKSDGTGISSQIIPGDYICFNGDASLDVIVAPMMGTITFDCENEDQTAHELYKEYNFCLEPSQMTDNKDGTQSVIFTTTGSVTVTATYETKQQTQLTITKPDNVAFATINVTGHKKEMEWTTSEHTVASHPGQGEGFRFDGTRIYRFDSSTQNDHSMSYSDDLGVTWSFSPIDLTDYISIGDLPNAIAFKRPHKDICISYDGGNRFITKENVLPFDAAASGGFKWSRNANSNATKYMMIYNYGSVATSSYGSVWETGPSLPDTSKVYTNGVYHVNGTWWTVNAATGKLYYLEEKDNDDKIWRSISPTGFKKTWIGSGNPAGLAYGSNIMMLISNTNRTIATSRDGFKTANWRNDDDVPGVPDITGLWDVCYANGNFIIGHKSNSIAYTSFHDGVMWSGTGSSAREFGISRDIDQNISAVINTESSSNVVNCSNLTITDISVTYDKLIPLDPSTVIEYKKIRLPEHSRYIDHSKNPPDYHLTSAYSNFPKHWAYSTTTGYWTNTDNTGNSTVVPVNGISGDYTAVGHGDVKYTVIKYHADGRSSDNTYGMYDSFLAGGLYRNFQDWEKRTSSVANHGHVRSKHKDAPAGTISMIMQTMTLPINAALWAGASGDSLHNQTQYKHKVTGATTNFDYSYLNNCATNTSSPYMYDITTEADLKSALDAIYTNISSWATRTEAKNV